MVDDATIDKFFPFGTYRPGQKAAIKFAVDSFAAGKDVVIIEAPTGSGKSAIGYTTMGLMGRSYYLTITKLLQDQLIDEFGGQLVELKGRNAYPCTYLSRYGKKLVERRLLTEEQLAERLDANPDCADGYCRTDCPSSERIGQNKCSRCFLRAPLQYGHKRGALQTLPIGMQYSACPYYEQVEQAIAADKTVMNFSSFLYQTQMTTRFDGARELMVIDEAHQVEPTLLDFVSMSLDDRLLEQAKLQLPKMATAVEYAIWMGENNVGAAIMAIYDDTRGRLDASTDPAERRELSRKLDDVGRLRIRHHSFMKDIEQGGEWVVEHTEMNVGRRSWRKLTLRPVLVHNFLRPLLLCRAKKVLMLSATILDVNVMCRSLGLDSSKVAYYKMRNKFPVKNRPIYIESCGQLTGGKDGMVNWGPAVASKVNEIVSKHTGVRGIIHTHSFAIAELLMERCSPAVSSRFTFQRRFQDKVDMLEYHAGVKDSVIVAPAMHEGVNLSDDLSRFQIIVKVPFPNFHENPQLRRRMEVDGKYYDWLTALKLVQSYGRSIRSEVDWADTYIIDGSITQFMQRCRRMLPDWFLEAVKINARA